MAEWTPQDDRRAYLGLIADMEQLIACTRESLEEKKVTWLRTGLHAHYCRYIADRVSLADMLMDLRGYVQTVRELEAAP